jgi:hypothetical protein
VALRGLLGLSTGVLIGSLTARALTGLMLSVALAFTLLLAIEVVVQRTYPARLWVSDGSPPSDQDLRLTYGKVLAPDGNLIEIMDAVALMPEGLWGQDDAAANAWLAEQYTLRRHYHPRRINARRRISPSSSVSDVRGGVSGPFLPRRPT